MVLNGDKVNGGKVELSTVFSRKSVSQISNIIESIEKGRKRLWFESGIVIAVPIPETNQSIGKSVDKCYKWKHR